MNKVLFSLSNFSYYKKKFKSKYLQHIGLIAGKEVLACYEKITQTMFCFLSYIKIFHHTFVP